jgi:hypothetical protein
MTDVLHFTGFIKNVSYTTFLANNLQQIDIK